ncbi:MULTISPECIES: YceD family protein [Paenibacillus]|uniref:YceD family protein n=1 Tax=Paenibacillus TaxID=44249 RepID=UPI0022B89E76|nr:DUF177 domain-containing protein [Paenibacillus caseinilyticus]MCZ8520101.1 DUF177 domain-containing protein [Paenibacillus caseinilyticus]
MFFHMKDLAAKGAIVLEGTEDLTGILPTTGSLQKFGPLEVRLEAVDKQGAAEVSGDLHIDVEQSCSRCLAPVHQHITAHFHETFVKGQEPEESEENDDDETDAVIYVSEDRVDLKPLLAEGVMLALPYVPLCSENCQGLCPVCGTDRNVEACGCKQDKVDPRLAGLADFFKQE